MVGKLKDKHGERRESRSRSRSQARSKSHASKSRSKVTDDCQLMDDKKSSKKHSKDKGDRR
eukprot:scaffold11198_cov103-Skeletonema_dohrnii-CCMP3373.AAC.8